MSQRSLIDILADSSQSQTPAQGDENPRQLEATRPCSTGQGVLDNTSTSAVCSSEPGDLASGAPLSGDFSPEDVSGRRRMARLALEDVLNPAPPPLLLSPQSVVSYPTHSSWYYSSREPPKISKVAEDLASRDPRFALGTATSSTYAVEKARIS